MWHDGLDIFFFVFFIIKMIGIKFIGGGEIVLDGWFVDLV